MSAVCIIFLFHLPSALVVILTLPIAIIISFICMYYLGVTSNIMSLSGIAIAIGAMVDASIIMVENAHKKLEEAEHRAEHRAESTDKQNRHNYRGGKGSWAVLIFLAARNYSRVPSHLLQAQAGRLFKPLAFTRHLQCCLRHSLQ